MGVSHEVGLVSDGSTDATVRQAEGINDPRLRVVSYDRQRGKGFALRYAWEHCTGEFVAFFDADLDLHPEALRGLFRLIQTDGADAAVGSKTHADSTVVYP